MTLKTTPSDVVATLGKLPVTVHPLDDPAKFVFDAWTMPGLLAPTAPGVEGETVMYATVHGEFTECTYLLYSYSLFDCTIDGY
jgi:nuclear RNA export factor